VTPGKADVAPPEREEKGKERKRKEKKAQTGIPKET
jgi:hypothetical protein